MTSSNGALDGGRVETGANWASQAGQDGVAGIGGPGVVNERALFDWPNVSSGFVSIAFSGGTVVNPIIFISSIDGLSQNFDFDNGLALTLLDSSPAGSVVLNPGNVVFNTGTGIASNGSSDDGFAVQLTGEFGSINFATNVQQPAAFCRFHHCCGRGARAADARNCGSCYRGSGWAAQTHVLRRLIRGRVLHPAAGHWTRPGLANRGGFGIVACSPPQVWYGCAQAGTAHLHGDGLARAQARHGSSLVVSFLYIFATISLAPGFESVISH